MTPIDLRPGASATEADRSLRRSLAALDHARRCAALRFADVMDRRLDREFGHPTVEVYAKDAFGFADNRTRQFIALAARMRRMPALRRCPECEAAFAVTSHGEKRLPGAAAAALRRDAIERDSGGHNRTTISPAVRRLVLDRDGHRCTTPGCTATRFLEVHHVKPRGYGGSNRPQNLTTLCHRCHRAAHET